MAIQRFTVAEYRARFEELPLPNGDEIEIFDSSGAIAQLTVDDIEGLATKGVTLLNAIDGALAFSLDQFQALGTVGFSAEDKLTLRDGQFPLQIRLTADVVQALNQKGFSAIDVSSNGNFVAISVETARACNQSVLRCLG
jgi:hypothetical protein